MHLITMKGDITKARVTAIVNAANKSLWEGGRGVIHHAKGYSIMKAKE